MPIEARDAQRYHAAKSQAQNADYLELRIIWFPTKDRYAVMWPVLFTVVRLKPVAN